MRVAVYEVNQHTGEEVREWCGDASLWLTQFEESERYAYEDELNKSRRVWIGGGAAPLFVVRATA